MKKIFIVAGEPSGDFHGSLLVNEIKNRDSEIQFYGLGGEKMRSAGVNIYYDLASSAVVGFFDVIKHISFFKKLFHEILTKIKEEQPEAVIFIDYPGFNLKLVKEVKKLNIKTIYYISPQLWAWGEKRVEIIKRYVDKMFVFFEFEKKFYNRFGVEVEFIGHPFLDIIKPKLTEDAFLEKYQLDKNRRRIFLMPGSRENEFKKHISVIKKSIAEISKKYELDTLLLISKHLKKYLDQDINNSFKIITDDTYNAIYHSHLGIVASGTATLEAAIIGNPFLVIYKTSLINYLILKPMIRVKHVGMVNLILKEEAMPELIQYKLRPKNLTKHLEKILLNEDYYFSLKEKLNDFKIKLGDKGAVVKAVSSILNCISN
ncbi:MAG: lipid-A-disaccharide synthase [Candidatus Kaelpia imicola]|nr:lipid-A-disaccharide synthase [Candidatus Kaelpia imicola]